MSVTDCPLFPTHSPADLFADQSFADPFPLPAECRRCYGMMGWRMGYLAYDESNSDLAESLLKVQDTIPICPTQISQHLSLIHI